MRVPIELTPEVIERAKQVLVDIAKREYMGGELYEIADKVWAKRDNVWQNVQTWSSVSVDGQLYSRTDIERQAFMYEYFPVGDDSQRYDVVSVDQDGQCHAMSGEWRCVKFSFAPFMACKVWSDTYGEFGSEVFLPVLRSRDKKAEYPTSTNPFAALYLQLGKYYGLKVFLLSRCRDPFCVEYRPSEVHFSHLLFDYGYNNAIYLNYRFDDLLAMDPALFEERDLRVLEKECKQTKIIKETLNFDVFKRPLTELEQVECAGKFMKLFPKLSGKREYFIPHIDINN